MSIHDERFTGLSSASADVAAEPTVLVPVFDEAPSKSTLDAATAIAEANSADLLFIKLVIVPPQTPLELPDSTLETHRRQLRSMLAGVPETSRPIHGILRIGHTPARVIATAAADHNAATVVAPAEKFDHRWVPRQLRPPAAAVLDAGPECSVVASRAAPDYERVSSLLVPVVDPSRDRFAVQVATAMAEHHDAWIEFLHVVPPAATEARVAEAERCLADAMAQTSDDLHADTWILEADDVATAVVEQSTYYDVAVVGTSRKSRLSRLLSGSTAAAIERRADMTVLSVREGGERDRVRRWLSGVI